MFQDLRRRNGFENQHLSMRRHTTELWSGRQVGLKGGGPGVPTGWDSPALPVMGVGIMGFLKNDVDLSQSSWELRLQASL